MTHDGEVDDVVAYVAELIDGGTGFGEDVADGVHLVGLALVDELELEVVGADGDGLGVALGDDADAETAETAEGDTEAVVGREAFCFDAMTLGVGNDEDLTVREDAVYVKDEDFYVFSAGFSGHSMMIPWRTVWSVRQGIEASFRLPPVTFDARRSRCRDDPSGHRPSGRGRGVARRRIRGPRRSGCHPSDDSRSATHSWGARGAGAGCVRRGGAGDRYGLRPGPCAIPAVRKSAQAIEGSIFFIGGISLCC